MMKDLEELEDMVKEDDAADLGGIIEDTTSYMAEHFKSFSTLRKKISKINDNADDILEKVDFYGAKTPRPPKSEF